MTHLKLMLVTMAMTAATTSFASANGKLWTVTGDHAACTDFSDFLDVGSGREVITSTESCIRLREGTLVYLDTAKDGPVNLKYSCLRPFQWFTSKRCYWTNTWAIMPEDIRSNSEHVTTRHRNPRCNLPRQPRCRQPFRQPRCRSASGSPGAGNRSGSPGAGIRSGGPGAGNRPDSTADTLGGKFAPVKLASCRNQSVGEAIATDYR